MIEVITGCMYSGKSEELIRRLRRCQIAGQHVLVLKPAIDTRYSKTRVATHIGATFEALPVRDLDHAREIIEGWPFRVTGEVLGFDEVQFMHPGIVALLEEQANRGRRVIVAGLDLDAEGRPFGPMADLICVADEVTKLHAVCVAPGPEGEGVCGEPATRSFRLPEHDSGKQIQVGSTGMYEARCRICWSRGRE